jgi:hypothetical protein
VKPSFHAVAVKLGSPFVGIDAENSQECLVLYSFQLEKSTPKMQMIPQWPDT